MMLLNLKLKIRKSILLFLGLFLSTQQVAGLKCFVCTENELDQDCWTGPEEYLKPCPRKAVACQAIIFRNGTYNTELKTPFQRDCVLEFEPKCLFGMDEIRELKMKTKSMGVTCGHKIFPTREHFTDYFECRFGVVSDLFKLQPLPVFDDSDGVYADMVYCLCSGDLCNGKQINDLIDPPPYVPPRQTSISTADTTTSTIQGVLIPRNSDDRNDTGTTDSVSSPSRFNRDVKNVLLFTVVILLAFFYR